MKIVKSQSGFTLIELVMVIVILGLMAAVAIPKFVDLSAQAAQAAVDGVAGGMSSAMASNYAARKAGAGVAIADCDEVGNVMQGGVPTGYTPATLGIAADATETCSVSDGTYSANFVGIGVN